MNKSISISDPSNVQSLVVQPYGSGDKIGGKLNLQIFSSATNIDVSDLDVEELGELPLSLVTFNGSNNKITNIPSAFAIPDSIKDFNLQKNSLTTLDINRILGAFVNSNKVGSSDSSDIHVIDISKLGNAVPDSDGLAYISTLNGREWNVKYNKGEYVLSSDSTSIVEGGGSVTINIDRTTSDIPDGTVVPFVILTEDDSGPTATIEAEDFTATGFNGGAAPAASSDLNAGLNYIKGSFTMSNNTASATFSLATDVGISKYANSLGEEAEHLVMVLFQLTDISDPNSPSLPDGTYDITVEGNPITIEVVNGLITTDIAALKIYVPGEQFAAAVPLAANGVKSLNQFNNQGSGYSIATGVATTTNGSGTNLTVDINRLNTYVGMIYPGVTSIPINNPGTGYLPNDTITITNPYGVGAILSGRGFDSPFPYPWQTYQGSGFPTGTTTNIATYYASIPNFTGQFSGNGTGFTVDVTADANGNVTYVNLNQPGNGYLYGDRLVIDAGNKPSVLISYVSQEATATVTETLGDINLVLTANEVDRISIPVVDTTIVPYELTSVSSTVEGNNLLITLATTTGTTVTNGTTVPYTITGIQANDIVQDLTGEFTLNDNTDIITIRVIADANANENETMILTLNDYPTVRTSIRLFDS